MAALVVFFVLDGPGFDPHRLRLFASSWPLRLCLFLVDDEAGVFQILTVVIEELLALRRLHVEVFVLGNFSVLVRVPKLGIRPIDFLDPKNSRDFHISIVLFIRIQNLKDGPCNGERQKDWVHGRDPLFRLGQWSQF